MTTLSYSSAHSSVSMFTCNGWAEASEILNLVILLLTLGCVLFSQKRLAFPRLLLWFSQSVYLLSLPNFLKDECMQNATRSFRQYVFLGLSDYFSTFEESQGASLQIRNYMHKLGHSTHLMSNLLGPNFLTVCTAMLVTLAILICFVLLLSSRRRTLFGFFYRLVDKLVFSFPLHLAEWMHLPALLAVLLVFADLDSVEAGNIAAAVIYSLIILVYYWGSIALLNTYLYFYLRADYAGHYRGLYEHLNFYSQTELALFLKGRKTSYRSHRALNLVRNHPTRRKFFDFAKAITFVFSVEVSDAAIPIAIFLVINLADLLIFVFVRKAAGNKYFYTKGADIVYIILNLLLALMGIFLLVNSFSTSATQMAGIVVMALAYGGLMAVIVLGVVELVRSQSEDALWKVLKERADRKAYKEEIIQLLKTEKSDNVTLDFIQDQFKKDRLQKVLKKKKKQDEDPGDDIYRKKKKNVHRDHPRRYEFLQEKTKLK